VCEFDVAHARLFSLPAGGDTVHLPSHLRMSGPHDGSRGDSSQQTNAGQAEVIAFGSPGTGPSQKLLTNLHRARRAAGARVLASEPPFLIRKGPRFLGGRDCRNQFAGYLHLGKRGRCLESTGCRDLPLPAGSRFPTATTRTWASPKTTGKPPMRDPGGFPLPTQDQRVWWRMTLTPIAGPISRGVAPDSGNSLPRTVEAVLT
jgi:hypothetical protein